MNILFVVGGSYKAFYLNNINKYRCLDLIVFQQGILYEFDYYNEFFGDGTIINEMLYLRKKFGCTIIAKIKTNLCGASKDEFLVCDEKGISIIDANRYFKVFVKGRVVLISKTAQRIGCDFEICFDSNANNMTKPPVFVCEKRGVVLYRRKIVMRKFRKICHFCLNF